MTNTRRTTSNAQFAIGICILLLALGMPWPSSARAVSTESTSESAQQKLRSSQLQFEGLEVDMMHRDHIGSRYAEPQLTKAERMKAGLERSRARVRFLESKRNSSISGVVLPEFPATALPEFLVNFSLGTPPRSFQGIADTGSEILWVQCKQDSSPFPEPDPIFDPGQSSSYEPVNCSTNKLKTDHYCNSCTTEGTCLFQILYLDNSTTDGDLATETLTLGSVSGAPQSFPDFEFGCAHVAQGSNAGDGLVGLNQGNDSLISQLGVEIFSFCLVDYGSATNKSSSLLLGSAGPLPLNYTPLLTLSTDPDSYYLNLTGISVDGQNIDYPADTFADGIVFDTGTSFTTLDSRAYTPLLDRLGSLITYPISSNSSAEAGFDLCFNVTEANPTFPSVSFHFDGGLELALPVDNVFTEIEDGYVCATFQNLGANNIFGNFQMEDFQIAIDLAEGRVGFAPTTC